MLYACYARVLFALFSVTLVGVLCLLPRGPRTWAMCRSFARMLLGAARVRVQSRGFDSIPLAGPVVFASNHASYIDGLVLLATLPRPMVFIAKEELRSSRLYRFVLDRLAARYVERFAVEESVEDAKRLAAAAKAGEPLLFFPEGTFRNEAGLLPFHLGAFATAAASGACIVPLALRGTRTVLRGDEWRPHWGDVLVSAGPPLAPAGDDWHAALALRDAARQFIVAHCGEPDRDDFH
jgi:1-acyl-sn-glycerol-3-phosphate acyltransferase